MGEKSRDVQRCPEFARGLMVFDGSLHNPLQGCLNYPPLHVQVCAQRTKAQSGYIFSELHIYQRLMGRTWITPGMGSLSKNHGFMVKPQVIWSSPGKSMGVISHNTYVTLLTNIG